VVVYISSFRLKILFWYFLEDTGDKIDFHNFKETSPNFLSVSTISDNTDNSTAKKVKVNKLLESLSTF
jgi:hypothetical protein